MEDFNKPKIVWGEISDRSKFAFDHSGGYVPEATTFLMVGQDLPYLLCVLNSPLSEWFFSKVGTTTGVGTVRWKKYTIQELLLPKYDKPKAFSAIVDDFTKGKITDKELASRANDLFYKLVGLTGEEVRFIETQ